MFRLSRHAQRRIRQRKIRVEWLLAALEGERSKQRKGGVFLLGDPASRCALVIDLKFGGIVVTVIKLSPRKYRRLFVKGRSR